MNNTLSDEPQQQEQQQEQEQPKKQTQRRFLYSLELQDRDIILYADSKNKLVSKFNKVLKDAYNINDVVKKSRFNSIAKGQRTRLDRFIKDFKLIPLQEYYKDELNHHLETRTKHTKIGDDTYNKTYMNVILRKETNRLYKRDEAENTFKPF